MTATAQVDSSSPTDVYSGYKLVFSDEFNTGTIPNTDIWGFEEGFLRNNEAQYYQAANATIADGNLVIEARKEAVKNKDYVKYSSDWRTKDKNSTYTSASMYTKHSTEGIGNWKYGRFEIRAKLPCYLGCWPAIWTLGTKNEWPYNGEIDMMEYYPSGGEEALHANIAWGTSQRWTPKWNSEIVKLSALPSDWRDEYHVWRMDWTNKKIKLYIDNNLVNSQDLDETINPSTDWYWDNNKNPYREHYQYLLLNLALGGINGGDVTNTPLPCKYLVDYVRIYQKDDGTGIESPESKSCKMAVYNISGQQLYNGTTILNENEAPTLPHTFNRGVYIVKTQVDRQTKTYKMVVKQ